jgi:GTP-sensing pleiotropic transcriptional regulator CodY
MTDFPTRIIEILRGCPSGLTSQEVADRLGIARSNISSRLSKLAAYGVICKVQGTLTSHGTKGAVYRALTPSDPQGDLSSSSSHRF